MVLPRNAKNQVQSPKLNRYSFPTIRMEVNNRLSLPRRNRMRRRNLNIAKRKSCTSVSEFKKLFSIKVKNLTLMYTLSPLPYH